MKFYIRYPDDEKYSGTIEIATLRELKCFFNSRKKRNVGIEFRMSFAERWDDERGWLDIHEIDLLNEGD